MKLTPFRIAEQMKKAALKRAKQEGRSFSGYIRHLIQRDIEDNSPAKKAALSR